MPQWAVVLVFCTLATSCVGPARTGRVRLQVSVAPDANENRPVPVDVVFVWDSKMAEKLEALPAADWFSQKGQLRQEDPAERTLTVREWEWVPGQLVPDIELAVGPGARKWLKAIFVFADYRSAGPHRVRIAPGAAAIALLREDLKVAPIGAASNPSLEPQN